VDADGITEYIECAKRLNKPQAAPTLIGLNAAG